jgi:hypothetical protein
VTELSIDTRSLEYANVAFQELLTGKLVSRLPVGSVLFPCTVGRRHRQIKSRYQVQS